MRDKLKKIMSSVFDIPEMEINDEISVAQYSKWDSLKHMKLIMAIEEEYGFLFDDSEIFQLTDLESIMASINKHTHTL